MKKVKGGKRNGSGRKKADYKTKTISFRVRVEFVEQIKKIVSDYISERIKGMHDAESLTVNKRKNLKA